MDRNTILAIVLSFIVLVVSLTIQTVFINSRDKLTTAEVEQTPQEQEQIEERTIIPVSVDPPYNETKYTITTDKARVTFTNKGGDIIEYKLLEHEDTVSATYVEMADNVTEQNRAFSLAFFGPESSNLNDLFRATQKDKYTIVFTKDYILKNNLTNTEKEFILQKQYTFLPNDYVFKLDIFISSKDGTTMDFGDLAYVLRTSPQVGPTYDSHNRYDVRQVLALNKGKRYRKNMTTRTYELNSANWVGVGSKYFVILIKPLLTSDISENLEAEFSNVEKGIAQISVSRKALTDKTSNDTYYIYVGPRQENELIKYNDQTKNGWNLSNVKFNEALFSSGILSPIEVVLKWCLEKINLVVKNWGVAIIILTIILKLILFPMNKKTAIGSLQMQKIQPKMQAIQEKYADDQQKMSMEMQKLYKDIGYNPMSGCLPMIIQMFILFALYNVFNNYFEFRGASFIKGWIDDLSIGDSIWTWNRNIFLISGITMNHLRLLPFIYTISQLLTGKITQYGGAGAGTRQGYMTFMLYGMPIVFFFLFYNVPSGLLLYWATSNIWQIGQQLVVNKMVKRKREEMEKQQIQDKNTIKFKGGKKRTR